MEDDAKDSSLLVVHTVKGRKEIDCGHQNLRTYGALREHVCSLDDLIDIDGINTAALYKYIPNDTHAHRLEPLDEDSEINPDHRPDFKAELNLLRNPFEIYIVNKGRPFKFEVEISSKKTVRELREDATRISGEELELLTHEGRRLKDDEIIGHLPLKESDKLHCVQQLFIRDIQADTSTVVDVFQHDRIFEVIKKYCDRTRRIAQRDPDGGAFLSLHQGHPESDRPEEWRLPFESRLEPDDTVYERNLLDSSEIFYNPRKFTVIFVEEKFGSEGMKKTIEVEVEDHWTIEQLKDNYSETLAQTEYESLLPQDKLVFDQVDLDDMRKTVQQYGLQKGSQILVQREDSYSVTMQYTCGDCGSDVKLKTSGDIIQCRECGYRIMFKQRAADCQYDTR